jgi:type I restriction enzyme S subunit
MEAVIREFPMNGANSEHPKQTEIGPVPESWTVGRLDTFCMLQRGFDITKDAQTSGSVPVVSSGGIKSYHNVAKVQGPGVVVGRKGTLGTVHYVEGPYWPHDTTLWVKDFRGNDPRFTSYFLDSLDFARFDSGASNPTLNRNTVHGETVAYPPLDEQRQIAAVLSAVRRGIERQERLIDLTAELKNGLMHKLFTEGTRGEPLKKTEIGPIPKSWNIVTLNDLRASDKKSIVSGPFGSNIGKRFFVEHGVPLIRGCNLTKGDEFLVEKGYVFITEEKAQELAGSVALEGDLVFTAAGTLGQVGLISPGAQFPKYVISNKQLRARLDRSRIRPEFVFHWFAGETIQTLIEARRGGASIPVINLSILKALPVPCPPVDEQDDVIQAIAKAQAKHRCHQKQRTSLATLFRTLLHQLITAQVRVHDLNLSALDELGAEPAGGM